MSDNKSSNCFLKFIDAFAQMTRFGHNQNKGWKNFLEGGKLCQEHTGDGEADGVLEGGTKFHGFIFVICINTSINPSKHVNCFDMLMCKFKFRWIN